MQIMAGQPSRATYDPTQSEYSTNEIKCFAEQPFGNWAVETLEIMNINFTPMHRHCYRNIWSNSMENRTPRNYGYVNWENFEGEWYIPVRSNLESNMNYYRIAVKIVPEIDTVEVALWQNYMTTPKNKPVGKIDSEAIIYLSPKRSAFAIREGEHQCRRWKGKLCGFKHENKPGYLTFIGINESPQIIIKRLLTVVANFIEKRLKALLKRVEEIRHVHLESWMLNYNKLKELYYSSIIERVPSQIRQSIIAFSKGLNWLRGKISFLKKEIGRVSQAKEALKQLPNMKQALKDAGLLDIPEFKSIKAKLLKISHFNTASLLKPLEHAYSPKKRCITGLGHYPPMEYVALLKNKRFNTGPQKDKSKFTSTRKILKLPIANGSRIQGVPTLNLRALKRLNQAPEELVIT